MTNGPSAGLHMCPDCGGILEPQTPSWAAAIEMVAVGVDAARDESNRWQCPLCGYQHEPTVLPDNARPLLGR